MSREHQQMMEKRMNVIQEEVHGVQAETAMFFKYSAVVAAAATAGVVGLGMIFPRVARLTPAQKIFGITLITPVPGYVWAEHEITRKAIERAALRHTYNIRDSEIERAKEYYNKQPFFYRYRTEMTVGLAILGLSTGIGAAYQSRHLTTQQKWVKARMWFSTAGVGTALGLALIFASSSQEQKEELKETKYQRMQKAGGR